MSHYTCAWVGGALLRVPALLICSIYSCIFIFFSMNKNYFAPGANYYDHHKDITINVNGANPVDLLRAALAEDVEPVKEEKSAEKCSLPFFVPAKLAELGTHTEEEFDGLYHDAVQGGAPKLAKFLKHYKELEVFDTKDLNKKETFEELKAYFGDELNFGYPNFAAYY